MKKASKTKLKSVKIIKLKGKEQAITPKLDGIGKNRFAYQLVI